ncbi:FixH family protein [Rhodoplanes sp. TEM]|uniref:FixH family protein n=1 Tax=Rhodoplanes tepidamans TaxID=200616 RepID=A0ABT5J9V6_RHOTP|nr:MULTISPECIES: FixH family protein [Rhodoplanes]MDC7786372.1 FixH family protein [Rhodoplanes tepidamans]MDC7985444.1 FixH family protein [Rhodoplanes sp. TEM]MDQ0354116.1 nitrogen fixation protein FixH [Rhodoplanes tepidamans]
METETPAAGRPLTGRRVAIYIVAFFAVVIGVNGIMMKLAIDTLPGTVVDSAYRASLAYNGEITAAQAQASRAWQVAAHVERNGDKASVRIEARDATDRPVSGLAVTARLARPTDRREDRPVEIAERGIGIYRGEAENVPAGLWELVIEAERGGDRVYLSKNRVVLP